MLADSPRPVPSIVSWSPMNIWVIAPLPFAGPSSTPASPCLPHPVCFSSSAYTWLFWVHAALSWPGLCHSRTWKQSREQRLNSLGLQKSVIRCTWPSMGSLAAAEVSWGVRSCLKPRPPSGETKTDGRGRRVSESQETLKPPGSVRSWKNQIPGFRARAGKIWQLNPFEARWFLNSRICESMADNRTHMPRVTEHA